MPDPIVDKGIVGERKNSVFPEMIISSKAPVEKLIQSDVHQKLNDQWQLFWQLKEEKVEKPIDPNNIDNNLLVHNLGYDPVVLSDIFASGVMSGELGFGNKELIPEDSETHFCADFFKNVDGDMTVASYIKRANTLVEQGIMVKKKPIQNYRCPNGDNNNISLLINSNDLSLGKLLANSSDGVRIEDENNPIKPFIDHFPHKTDSHVAVLVGIPANFINGIVVGGKIEKDTGKLNELKGIMTKNNIDVPILNVLGRQV